MKLENFYQNQKLLDEGRKFIWCNFLIQSDGDIESTTTDFFTLYSLKDQNLELFNCGDHFFYPNNENIAVPLKFEDLKKRLESYKILSHIYLLRMKIPSMEGDINDSETINVIHLPDIRNHILNLLSLCFRPLFFKDVDIHLSDNINLKLIPEIESKNERLIFFINEFRNLREDQFMLAMNSLYFFNLSKFISHTDTIYAFTLLCSSIETFSQSFPIEKDFRNHPIGQLLKKTMQNAEISDSTINEVMEIFGKQYEAKYLYQTTKNFQHWCESMLDKSTLKSIYLYQTDKTRIMFKELISFWYSLRSLITHGCSIDPDAKRNVPIIFNERNDNKNVKEIQSIANPDINLPIIFESLPFNNMVDIAGSIIEISIDSLNEKKEMKDEATLYSRISPLQTGNVKVCLKKDGLQPFMLLRVGIDTYKPYTIMDHYHNLRVFDEIINLTQGNQLEKALDCFKKLQNISEMSDEELFTSLLAVLNEITLKLNNFQPTVQFIDQAEINIKSSRFWALNDKALALSRMGDNEKAHEIMDQLIVKEESKSNQKRTTNTKYLIIFYDSKGDIYVNQKNFPKAKEYFDKSLAIGESEFSEQTRQKITQINEIFQSSNIDFKN